MLIGGTVIAIIVVNALFGLGVFMRNRRSSEHVLFSLFAVFVNLWIISNFLENEPGLVAPDNLAFFLQCDFAFAVVLLLTWFLFCDAFVKRNTSVRTTPPWLLWVLACLGFLFSAGSFSPLVIRNIAFYEGIIHFDTGPFWIPYAVVLLIFAAGGLGLLFAGRRQAHRMGHWLAREQIDLILAGFFLSVGNALVINLFLQTFIPITLTLSRLGLYGFVILVGFTGYAITRGLLFDLRFAIVRTVSYMLLLAVLALGYALILFSLNSVLAGGVVDLPFLVPLFIITIVVTLSFQPIAQAFRKASDRIFFQGRYDPEKLLADLTLIMAETIDLHLLSQQVLRGLLEGMHITKGAFLFTKDKKGSTVEQVGFDGAALFSKELEDIFSTGVRPEAQCLLFDELEAGSPLRNLFRKYEIALMMFIKVEGKEVAMLVLGSRQSGERYYEREVRTLAVFSEEAGIAIQNAQSYEAVRNFNEELEKTVEERTKELKETHERELAKARDVARLKDEFVFIAAHELKAPVAAIKGFVELAGESKDVLPEKVRHYLDSISHMSNDLVQLVGELLEIARSEEGTLKVGTTSVATEPIAEDVLKELAPVAAQQRVALRMGAHENVPSVSADTEKVKEIMMNLVSNAIKYNRNGGFVEVSFRTEGTNLLIEVRDNGYGIPGADQGKIFEKFFRSSNAAERGATGTGLGLFICRMLAARMGGALSFSSKENEGSSFALSLPLEK